MPIYLWQGQDRKGAIQKGEIEATDETAVNAQLRRMRIKPTKIKKIMATKVYRRNIFSFKLVDLSKQKNSYCELINIF